MGSTTSRRYFDAPDLDRLTAFSEKTTGDRLPRATYVKPGDVVWMSYDPRFDRHANIKLWFDGQDLVAYAWFEPPLQVSFDISAESAQYDAIGAEILAYAEGRRQELLKADEEPLPRALAMLGDSTVSAIALTGDRARISLLDRHGYHQTERFSVFHSRTLTDGPIEVPKLPAGLRLRHATDDDIDERAEVHRDSWSVWGQSKFTADVYRRLRAAPLYDQTLDIVLENAEGKFLSYCLGWIDVVNGLGHFEPVGCRPDCTGRGYARAVMLEGMRRMQSRGIHTAMVNTESVNALARRTYVSLGFVETDRAYFYVKNVGAKHP